ncbi:1-acyl-sn-glycerol-3-phosphate acyltransferase [Pelagibacterales bacterium SAG-MED31]|nr:1-acyl-sn-glycerol-3-phosphate acyltransferase [Pelagibacterales bacterium SAG-MED31]
MLLLTIIFYGALASWTILMGVLSLPFVFLPSKFIALPAKIWIKGLFICLKYICGVTHEIRGLTHLSDEPIIIVSKHQSAFETFALYYYLKKSFFIHKKQLFYIPIFGQYLMKHNMVSIDRAGQASTMRKMISDVKKKLDSGSTIIIFPEGTRKKPGEKADYKTGFIGIYNTSKRKLQPVALNSGLFWQKGLKVIKRGHIIIEFLPQIDIGLDKKEVLKKVENSIELATKKLLN